MTEISVRERPEVRERMPRQGLKTFPSTAGLAGLRGGEIRPVRLKLKMLHVFGIIFVEFDFV